MTIARTLITLAMTGTLGLTAGQTDAKSAAFPHLNPLLKAWLQKDLGAPDAAREKLQPTRAVSAAVALSTSKTEVFVYLTGHSQCGSGGCTLLILEFNGRDFTRIGEVTAWAPIRVIDGAYGDHPDLVISVHGGGVVPDYATKIHFAGGHYPMDGAVVSGPPLKTPGMGRLMISGSEPAETVYH